METRKTFNDLQQAGYYELSSAYMLVSQLSGTSHQSFKIKSSDLMSQLFNEYTQTTSLKSMAYESEGDYAKQQHDHDIYTSAYWSPSAVSNPKQIFKIKDTTHSTSYSYMNAQQQNSSQSDGAKEYFKNRISSLQPKIGEVMFTSSTSYALSTDASHFIGWLPADGTTYQLTDFVQSVDLRIVFGAPTSPTFTVPRLQEFIRFDPTLAAKSTNYVASKTYLAQHTHPTDSSGTLPHISAEFLKSNPHWGIRTPGEFQGTKKVHVNPKTSFGDWGSGSHYGKGQSRKQDVQCVINLSQNVFDNSGLATYYDGKENAESYPSYINLPAYVYVGRSRHSNPLYNV